MKTILRKAIVRDYYLTADDAPMTANAAQWLDNWQKRLSARGRRGIPKRGYGGPVNGHWLKLTKEQKAQFEALAKEGASK